MILYLITNLRKQFFQVKNVSKYMQTLSNNLWLFKIYFKKGRKNKKKFEKKFEKKKKL